MAETLEENIVITATGGDGAAAQVDQVNKSFQAINTTHRDLQGAFSQRFEHIGLRMFAGQLLQTNGLAGETRPIISTLMLSTEALAGVFGAAAGPILLVVSALTALAGIAVAVINHHKNEYDALQKEMDARQKNLNTVDATIAALDHYATSGGRLTQAQKTLLAASQALEQHLRTEQITTLEKEIKSIENQRQAIIDHANTLAVWHAAWEAIKVGAEQALAVIMKMLDPLNKLSAFISQVASGWGSFSTGVKKSKEDTDAMNVALLKNQELLAQKKADLEALRHGFDVTGDAAITAQQKELEGRKKVEAEMKAAIDDEHAHERASMDSLIAANVKAKQQEAKQEMEISKQIGEQMGRDIGDAFAKMIVEGKDFTQQMQQAFTRMAEQIISDIVRIEIEWAVLEAMGYPAGGGGFFGGAFASGGSVVVDKPTMFLAGEAGPEMATFTPLGSSGGGGGGGGAGSIGAVNINLSVGSIQGNDPAGTLQMLSEEIRRETASARQFAATVAGVAARYPKQAY